MRQSTVQTVFAGVGSQGRVARSTTTAGTLAARTATTTIPRTVTTTSVFALPSPRPSCRECPTAKLSSRGEEWRSPPLAEPDHGRANSNDRTPWALALVCGHLRSES